MVNCGIGYVWWEKENVSKKIGRKMLGDVNSGTRGAGWTRGAG